MEWFLLMVRAHKIFKYGLPATMTIFQAGIFGPIFSASMNGFELYYFYIPDPSLLKHICEIKKRINY